MGLRLSLGTLAIASLLALGPGNAAAVSGVAGDGSAGIAQYPQAAPDVPPVTLGPEQTPSDQGDVLGDEQTGPPLVVQPDSQIVAGGDERLDGAAAELPFTGLALMTLLLAGTALLTAGFLLRRRTSSTAV